MSRKTELAASLRENYNCAQSVFGAFCADYDVDAETALKIACPLGGGMRCGEVCGAASGALLALGAAAGQYLPGDDGAKENCYTKTAEFIAEFRRRCGAVRCAELLGIDISVPGNRETAAAAGLFETRCAGFVEAAVEILEEMGL